MRSRATVIVLALALSQMLAVCHSFSQEAPENARKIVARVAPQYPSIARSMGIQGNVRAVALVAPNGTVKSVEVKGGHPLLAEAAQKALRQWKFENTPHESYEIIEIRFAP